MPRYVVTFPMRGRVHILVKGAWLNNSVKWRRVYVKGRSFYLIGTRVRGYVPLMYGECSLREEDRLGACLRLGGVA